MSKNFKSAITMAVMLFAGFLTTTSTLAQAAPASPLADQLKAQYKLAKVGTDFNITEAGIVLVIQTDGILRVPPGSAAVCPATYSDGALHTQSTADSALCGKVAKKLNAGEKVYAVKMEVDSKKDKVSLLVVGCGACDGAPQSAAYKSQLIFQFPKGYLTAADAGQIEDVIGLVLSIDNNQEGGVPGSLTNRKIIEMVKVKVPDSMVIATIKSSTCDFDTTTPDALIKLKTAGVSDFLLQAMAEAMKPPDPEPPPTAPVCSDYGACISKGNAALGSAQWDDALAAFQAASQHDPSKGDAWAGIGNAYFQLGQYDDAASNWDKVLQLGATLTFVVCHARAACGDFGTFSLNMKEASFVNKKGEKEFVAAPSAVTSEGGVPFSGHAYYLQIRFGKNWRFYYLPNKAVGCGEMGFICPEPGPTQQKIVGDYLHDRLARIGAGNFSSGSPKP